MIKTIAAGVLLALAAGPNNRWYLVPVALMLLLRAIDDVPWKSRLRRGWLAAGIMFVVSLAWTRQFSAPGWIALSVYQPLFFAVAAAITPQRKFGIGRQAMCFVAAMTLAELLRIRFPLGGLPLGGFTTSAANSEIAWSAAVVGEVGMVTILAAFAVALNELFRVRKARRMLIALPVVLPLVLGFEKVTHQTERNGEQRVVTVQAGGPQALKVDEQDPARVFDDHYRLTKNLGRINGFIVWPEDVIDVNGPIDATTEGNAMSELAESTNSFIGAGVVETVENRRFHNAFVVWAPDGSIVDRYEKFQRVPFGEYVPMRSFLDRFVDLSQVPSDAIAGRGASTVQLGDTRAAVAVSFEGLFSRRVRSGVREGGEIVLIPTNAASYESPRVAETQVMSAQFRAIESGRRVVQSAPTGISAFIDSDGSVREQSAVGGPAVLDFTIPKHSGRTFYTKWGDTPLFVLSFAVLLFTWGVRIARREQDRDPQGDERTGSC